jgi:hypothetical protein
MASHCIDWTDFSKTQKSSFSSSRVAAYGGVDRHGETNRYIFATLLQKREKIGFCGLLYNIVSNSDYKKGKAIPVAGREGP